MTLSSQSQTPPPSSNPPSPSASSATAPTCRVTVCPPRKSHAYGLAAKGGLPIKEKAVPGLDEDVATMSIEAARNAMSSGADRPTGTARRLGRVRIASVCGEAHLHHRRGSDRRSPARRPRIGSSPAKPAPKRWSRRWASSARTWHITPWRSAWTPRKASPATRSNTRQARAARRISSVRRKNRWRSSTRPIPTSPTRPISGGAGGEISRARHALHGRARLLQAHHRSCDASDGSQRHDRQGLQVGDLSSAEHEVPADAWPRSLDSRWSRSTRGCWSL